MLYISLSLLGVCSESELLRLDDVCEAGPGSTSGPPPRFSALSPAVSVSRSMDSMRRDGLD